MSKALGNKDKIISIRLNDDEIIKLESIISKLNNLPESLVPWWFPNGFKINKNAYLTFLEKNKLHNKVKEYL